jgi:hypothetical protein
LSLSWGILRHLSCLSLAVFCWPLGLERHAFDEKRSGDLRLSLNTEKIEVLVGKIEIQDF